MRKVVIGLVIALMILHQDWWWWDDHEPLVFGFIPIGLAYHCFLSLAAGVVWALAVMYCWPESMDVEDEGVSAAAARRHREL